MRRHLQSRRALAFQQLELRAMLATLLTGFTESAIATDLNNGTAMEIAPNGDLWVLEQAGVVKRFVPGSTTADVVGNLSTLGMSSSSERGLLGIAFDPAYATNKFVYLYYTSTSGGTHNRISRFTVVDSEAADYYFTGTSTAPNDAGSSGTPTQAIIFELDPLSAGNHNGGAIHFGPDGKLYAAVGENAVAENAQILTNLLGKMLRINSDGSIPDDNPFYNDATGDNRAIWALGLRNPYTFTFQPGTGRMLINDVGETTWEEINEGVAGANYGWSDIEGNEGTPPSSPGTYRGPLYTYSHGSGTFQGNAITGGAFYNPTTQQFPADYAGDYFFADYVRSWINVRTDNTVRRFATNAPSVVDLRVASDGSLYYLARGSGTVMRVQYTGAGPSTLHVRTLTPTDTGFVAQLSRPITTADLNLFDQGGTFGAADSTLTSAAGNVRGSLTLNAAGDQVTFVRTSGALANGIYTVTLRSASNAFHDGAALLDGNANGTVAASDNFVSTFEMHAAGTPTIASIPDVARGPGQVVDVWNFAGQGAYEGIPVLLSTGAGVRDVSFTILYDPTQLTIDAVKLGPSVAAGSTLAFDIPTPGTINVSVTNATADLSATAGQLALVSLLRSDTANPGQFLSPLVPAGATYGRAQPLDITDLQMNGPGDVSLVSVANDGVHVAAFPGDLSGNQRYNAPDTSFTQQLVLNPNTFGVAAYPRTDVAILADIDASGSVQGNDASQIQRLILNQNVPFVPPRPETPAPLVASPSRSAPADEEIWSDEAQWAAWAMLEEED